MEDLFKQWCKETKRSESVLLGSSIREFFKWLDENNYYLINVKKNEGNNN